jgi:hypothetical protein
MVKKADGSWRCCGNYCRLNNVTVPDTYPLPNMMDFFKGRRVLNFYKN